MSGITITPYFSPKSISGCQLWLDGADPAGTGVVPSSGTLATWTDKSTAGNNATGGVSPTYSSATNTVSFNGSSTYLQTSVTAVPTNETVFAVFTNTMPIINANRFNCLLGTSANYGRDLNILTSAAGNSSAYDLRYDSWAIGSISLTGYGGVTYNTLTLASAQFTGGQGAGSTYGSNFGTFQSLSFSGSGTTRIGAGNGGDYFNGTVNEIIIYNTVLGSNDRKNVEAYLSQKWALASSLPSGHPGLTTISYRSSIPTPLKVTPYSFPASTIVYTGSLIPYTVPAACTSLTFNMWGAGGPGGSGGMPGGGGAYLTGNIAVTAGEVLQLIVGRGGQYGTATQWSTMTNAEGGGGGGGGLSGQGGQGGGRTAIQKLVSGSYLEVVTAGGGGSAGGNAGTYGGNAYYTGTSQNAGTTYGQGRVPTGGSATTGGLNTFTARVGFPWDGTQFTGGFASNAFNVSPVTGACGGGGGGGGYYGGGGGGRSGADTYGGGGGGSYNNGTYITNFSGSNGTSNVAVASGIAGYITGCGRGGNGGSTNNGSNGLIVITPVSPNPIAAFKTSFISGGASSANGIYTVLTFSYPGGTLVVNKSISATILVIGGGGGGGGAGVQTGGGGAGGAVYVSSPVTISSGSYTVTVGQGGPASTSGGNSTFLSYTGYGGGRGGNWINGAGVSGGCGGGGSGEGGAGASGTQGFGGGSGRSQNTCGGGGGGMGSAGGTPNGGNGLAYSITGTSIVYAGGGGGNGGGGLGGTGGGGNATANGTNDLGGGGGGGGGTGGHGIVIISYVFV